MATDELFKREKEEFVLVGDEEIIQPITMLFLALNKKLEKIERKVECLQDLVVSTRDKSVKPGRRNHPKVYLYFKEKQEDVDPEYPSPIEMEVSFRWMEETQKSLSANPRKLNEMALKIKNKFAKPIFKIKKGKNMYTYFHWEEGYQFQLQVANKPEAKRITEQILDLRGHSPDWEFFNTITNENPAKRYPIIPEKQIILGDVVKTRSRPIGTVHFQYAFVVVPPKKAPVYLVDVTGKKVDAIIQV